MPATAKAKASAKQGLESVYSSLVELMRRHAPPFRTDVPCMAGTKNSLQLTVPKPVAVPNAYGGRPVDLQMAAVILQKDYVGFYLMCIYTNDGLKKKLSPALLKLLKGKTCFHVKNLDESLRKDIEAALEWGAKCYKERGWA